MGFWHTGYIEFHEPVGLDRVWDPQPVRHVCARCGESFTSEDDLRRHRFQEHPLRRPTLFFSDRELGAQRVRVSRHIEAAQVRAEFADTAEVNGKAIAVAKLGRELAKVSDGVCTVRLLKDGIDATFELEIQVASQDDLRGVEETFNRLVASRRLDTRTIQEFADECKRFATAIGYYDGIFTYLYGLLAKERAPDCNLPHQSYIDKFSRTAETLGTFDRPLAQTIVGLVEFHFNHFGETARMCADSRLGKAAGRFAGWMRALGGATSFGESEGASRLSEVDRIAHVLAERDTGQILHWASLTVQRLSGAIDSMEEFVRRDHLAPFDAVKVRMLLATAHIAVGNRQAGLKCAKALRNVPDFERWAEGLISKYGDGK